MALAAVRDLRERRPEASPEELAEFETDVLAGFVLARASAGLAMAFKLIESAQARWRAVNAPHQVALVRAGARFKDGTLVERPDDQSAPPTAA